MRPAQRIGLAVALFSIVGCNGITPNPLPTQPAPVALVAQKIIITIAPGELPSGGGVATIRLEVQAADGRVVRDVPVTITASGGTLERSAVTSDFTGHAETTWQGDATATVRATSETAAAEAPIVVRSTEPTPTPPTPAPQPPSPTPTPTPTPTPAPSPTPSPLPGPAGDLALSITASPAAPNASTPVTLGAILTSSTGAALPRLDWFAWDVNGDLANDHVGTNGAPIITYPAGTYTVYLTARTSDSREVTAQRTLVVDIAPTIGVALSPSTSTPDLTTLVIFTATVTPTGPTGAITSYVWDFDGNGSTDQTTAGNAATMTGPYATIGSKTARVTVTSANGQTASASTTVTVAAPDLIVGLDVAPAGNQPAGTALIITATVTSTGAVPGSMTFSWDYSNDGTADEVTTGGSPRSVTHAYNTSGAKTLRVTVRSPDGRTATNTIPIPVT